MDDTVARIFTGYFDSVRKIPRCPFFNNDKKKMIKKNRE